MSKKLFTALVITISLGIFTLYIFTQSKKDSSIYILPNIKKSINFAKLAYSRKSYLPKNLAKLTCILTRKYLDTQFSFCKTINDFYFSPEPNLSIMTNIDKYSMYDLNSFHIIPKNYYGLKIRFLSTLNSKSTLNWGGFSGIIKKESETIIISDSGFYLKKDNKGNTVSSLIKGTRYKKISPKNLREQCESDTCLVPADSDPEDIELVGEDCMISFEQDIHLVGNHKIHIYPQCNLENHSPQIFLFPKDFSASLSLDKGIEAFTSWKKSIIVLPEKQNKEGIHSGLQIPYVKKDTYYTFSKNNKPFYYKTSPGFSVKSMSSTSAGIWILETKYQPRNVIFFGGMSKVSIKFISAEQIKKHYKNPKLILTGEEIAFSTVSKTNKLSLSDNFEGLFAKDVKGGVCFTMITDSNYTFYQDDIMIDFCIPNKAEQS